MTVYSYIQFYTNGEIIKKNISPLSYFLLEELMCS